MLRLRPDWFEYIYIQGSYKKVVIKKKYRNDYKEIFNFDIMIRITNIADKFCAVKKYNANRYRINFDKEAIIIDGEDSGLAKWSVQDYKTKPTTEQVQSDVKAMTIQRYKDEGLEPPSEESIDVSAYVIE